MRHATQMQQQLGSQAAELQRVATNERQAGAAVDAEARSAVAAAQREKEILKQAIGAKIDKLQKEIDHIRMRAIPLSAAC